VEGDFLNDRIHQAHLVLRSQAGDREALEELLRGLQAVLYHYIRRLVGHLRALEEPQFFRAWAYRIATRASFAFLRRKRLWLVRHEEDVELDELPSGLEESSAILVAQLHLLLSEVSPASRAVLALHYLEDLSIHEVAAILQLSAGTVKSRLAYGLNCLRTATERKGEPHG
jgi:RNA polymerase sigma-70 factor (ECF subfamily)